jgi:hypothetical protein
MLEYYEMFKKFADENGLQSFKFRFIVQYEQTGTETITDFYAQVVFRSGAAYHAANKNFDSLLELIESAAPKI